VCVCVCVCVCVYVLQNNRIFEIFYSLEQQLRNQIKQKLEYFAFRESAFS